MIIGIIIGVVVLVILVVVVSCVIHRKNRNGSVPEVNNQSLQSENNSKDVSPDAWMKNIYRLKTI